MVVVTEEPVSTVPVRRRWWSSQRLLALVAAGVFLFGAAMTLVGATQIGISTDQPVHQSRVNVWFETGWYAPERFFDERGERDTEIESGRWHAYGGGYSLVGHVAGVLVGAEEWGTTNRSSRAYAARGLVVAALGITAAAAAGLAVGLATGSRLGGLWTAAAALALPLWTGYSMFAVKDIPAAAGWTFVTAGLVVALCRGAGRWQPAVVGLLCAAGVWFSFGVRTALWVPLTVSVVCFGVLAVVRWPAVRRNVIAAGIGLAAGVAAVAAVHYRNAATPVEWLLAAVRTSGDFAWTGTTLTAGRTLPEKPPWWYLPAWVGGSTPVLLGLLAAAGVVLVAVALVRRGEGGAVRGRLAADGAVMTLFVLQATMLPLVATVGNATMYAGLRQHLYVLPAVAALAGYAAVTALRRWPGGVAGWSVAAALGLALLIPAVEQLQLHPFQYVYKNVAAGPVNDRWESDMHLVSGREALSRVPATADAWCYTRPREPLVVRSCLGHRLFRPFAHEQGSDVRGDPAGAEVWVIGRQYRGRPLPAECVDAGSVVRRLRGEEIVLTRVLRCSPEVADR